MKRMLLLLGDIIRLRIRNLLPQFNNLPFHLCISTTLSNTLEVRFDLAIEFKTSASRTIRPWVLLHIASKLQQ